MSEVTLQNRDAAPVAARPNLSFTPRFDLQETDSEYLLVGDLPGVEPQDLDIRFEKQELQIHGKVAPRQSQVAYLQEEYGVGDFYRTFSTGESVDGAGVVAELKDGVLTIHLPKRAEVRPRRIEVKAG